MYFVFFSFLLPGRAWEGISRGSASSEYRRQSLVVFIPRQSPGTIKENIPRQSPGTINDD